MSRLVEEPCEVKDEVGEKYIGMAHKEHNQFDYYCEKHGDTLYSVVLCLFEHRNEDADSFSVSGFYEVEASANSIGEVVRRIEMVALVSEKVIDNEKELEELLYDELGYTGFIETSPMKWDITPENLEDMLIVPSVILPVDDDSKPLNKDLYSQGFGIAFIMREHLGDGSFQLYCPRCFDEDTSKGITEAVSNEVIQ